MIINATLVDELNDSFLRKTLLKINNNYQLGLYEASDSDAKHYAEIDAFLQTYFPETRGLKGSPHCRYLCLHKEDELIGVSLFSALQLDALSKTGPAFIGTGTLLYALTLSLSKTLYFEANVHSERFYSKMKATNVNKHTWYQNASSENMKHLNDKLDGYIKRQEHLTRLTKRELYLANNARAKYYRQCLDPLSFWSLLKTSPEHQERKRFEADFAREQAHNENSTENDCLDTYGIFHLDLN